MKHIIKSLLNNKYYIHAATISLILGVLGFTGCSSTGGIAEGQSLTKRGVASYWQASQEKPQMADSDSDPGYEWFY